MTDLTRWHDRVALVTGGTGGIGRAVAEALLEQGLRVAVCGRRQEALGTLSATWGDRIDVRRLDVRDEAGLCAWFDHLEDRWGGVDVLVNNAGLGADAGLVDGETEAFRELLDVNVLALAVATREAVSRMRARGVDDGQIVHIASMSSHRVAGGGLYAATKHAVRGHLEALRHELRELDSGIRVGAVSPGFVDTDFAANMFGSEEAAAAHRPPYPMLQANDIADAVCWLLGAPPHMQVHDILLRPTRQPT